MKRRLSHELMILLPIGLALMLTGKHLMPRVAAQTNLDLDKLDDYIATQMATQNIPGLALAITRGDTVLYAHGYGTARPEQPMTSQTQLFIASVSKSFTALAIMQLVEAGKVNLDLPVQSYLPEFTIADPDGCLTDYNSLFTQSNQWLGGCGLS